MREEPAGARMVENTDLIKLPGLEHADVGGVDSVYDLLGGGGSSPKILPEARRNGWSLARRTSGGHQHKKKSSLTQECVDMCCVQELGSMGTTV